MRALLAGALVLLVAAGCGGGEEQPAGGTAVDAAAGNTVAIADFEFDPPTITVDAGTEVTWKNSDEAAHTASAVDGSFDTGALDPGEEGAVALDRPGTQAYVCEFHPLMKGTIDVK